MLSVENFRYELEKIIGNPNRRFLLAVSGGADSMVLAHLFRVLGLQFQVAHVNYKLRGEASDLDQKIVEDFCTNNGIKLHIYKVREEEKPKNSIQIWARNLRYGFFFKILNDENLDGIVTAHHLNDELETFLINISRGSGIRGLSGIPENENKILRPLLPFTKQEIYDFAETEGIPFREDGSNKKNDYLRNKFRNGIIPKINEVSPDFLDGFKNSVNHLKNANTFIQNEIESAFRKIVIKSDGAETVLDKAELFALHPFLITEIILKLGFRGEEISKITSAENGKMFRSKTHEIYISRSTIICIGKANEK